MPLCRAGKVTRHFEEAKATAEGFMLKTFAEKAPEFREFAQTDGVTPGPPQCSAMVGQSWPCPKDRLRPGGPSCGDGRPTKGFPAPADGVITMHFRDAELIAQRSTTGSLAVEDPCA